MKIAILAMPYQIINCQQDWIKFFSSYMYMVSHSGTQFKTSKVLKRFDCHRGMLSKQLLAVSYFNHSMFKVAFETVVLASLPQLNINFRIIDSQERGHRSKPFSFATSGVMMTFICVKDEIFDHKLLLAKLSFFFAYTKGIEWRCLNLIDTQYRL